MVPKVAIYLWDLVVSPFRRPKRSVIYTNIMDLDSYIEMVSRERKVWNERNTKVWDSIEEAEKECDALIAKMLKIEDVKREQIRSALLECGFWYPPTDTIIEDWTVCPSVQAYVLIRDRKRFVKLRYRI